MIRNKISKEKGDLGMSDYLEKKIFGNFSEKKLYFIIIHSQVKD